MSLNNLEMFAAVQAIEEHTRELQLDGLSKDDLRALRAFRFALRWKAEGKPDGYNGDDLRNKCPLAEDS